METLRVLITDDEPGMRLGVRRVLSDFRVDVPDIDAAAQLVIDEADCGETALEKILEQPPDILILDHKMSGISGLDVLDRLQGNSGDMLTIMITAYASIETAVRAVKRGAYDFLAKPFTPDELRNTVKKAAVRIVLAKQARRLADQRNNVRLQLMRTLSRELHTPLNAIDGYLDQITHRAQGDQLDNYDELLQQSREGVRGMRRLIRDLLRMTAVESQPKNPNRETVDVVEAARRAIETFEQQAKQLELTIDLYANGPLTMQIARHEMRMVLQNLISNAVNYNRRGGQIHVTLDRNGDTVAVGVSDTGWGIDASELERLCDEFVRVKNEHTRDVSGTGLGLAIVKKIARHYDGEILIDSEPGYGSKFTVLLHDPATNANPPHPPQPATCSTRC